jgi:hypothetical protein
MATLLLAAAGSALGGAFGGSFAGLGAMALGKAAGALVGSAIDQRLLGAGAEAVESGRVERFRVMGSSEGAPLARVWGRARVAGQLIWSSRFLESVHSEEVGGKGGGGATVREYSYSVSLAVALCEGEVSRIGRIWADGQPVDQSGLTVRLHRGTEDQLPDPLILAIEGTAPAYRGTAYLVVEALDLTPYGNRIPQLNVEVFRRPVVRPGLPRPPALDVRGVALVPGTGEYALATEPVRFLRGQGESRVANVHNDRGLPDLVASLEQLAAELPGADSVSLVTTWFGDDLRCGACALRPAVEQAEEDGDPLRWSVSGVGRAAAAVVSRSGGRPVFGGTPADVTVVQAIRHLNATGRRVMFYPFILMDIQAGNLRADPWSGAPEQPAVPWRGRITLAAAPGRPGSSDRTPAAAAEVAAFFGTAAPGDFTASGEGVAYHGPAEWSYRRFVLHYAHLCALAGGVEAFCIGSEMRSLTQIRDGADGYPAVEALCALAEDVRAILGPATKIGYAADWSEYFGHQPADGSGDVFFHLDPLWASAAIDFVGIDNYMPLSDWRDGVAHADAAAGSIYDLGYLRGNVAGGEGYDWYYADAAGRAAQDRLPISDGAYGEDWVFRYKDLVNWWSQPHHDRPGGVRAATPTAWQPRSKPIWFTEIGCPAVDKATNQPNVFYDPKSSESFFPYFSSGSRDEFIQHRYLQAMFAHWADPENNPASDVYAGRMVDMERAHVWAWDARPWPDFPDRITTWTDGANHACGHWLNGRASLASLAEVVAEIGGRCGLDALALDRLHGGVTGYSVEAIESGRQSLQPLMLGYAFDSFADDGRISFVSRGGTVAAPIAADGCVVQGAEPAVSLTRSPASEAAERVTVGFVRADLDYAPGAVEALAPDAAEPRAEQMALPIVFSEGEARRIAERALSEGRVGRDALGCVLPPSQLGLTPGDLVALGGDLYRIDRIEDAGARALSGVRVEPAVYEAPLREAARSGGRLVEAPGPAEVIFLDLPLLDAGEDPLSPHVAVAAVPWTGPVAIYASGADHGYAFDRALRRPAVIGTLLEPLPGAAAGRWMAAEVRVRVAGSLQSRSELEVLGGANAAALRHGDADWEVIQFRDAELVAPQEYRLRGLLRGQAGTDGVMPAIWPAGTDFVLLDAAVPQLALRPSARGVERHYRAGPASRGYDDASYVHRVEVFEGVGLRPYRPVHLTARRRDDGAVELGWIRRTRIDGDGWAGREVPLGEEAEAYVVRVLAGAALLREAETGAPRWSYGAAEQAVDEVSGGASGGLVFEVAQISGRFGPGPFERIVLDG